MRVSVGSRVLEVATMGSYQNTSDRYRSVRIKVFVEKLVEPKGKAAERNLNVPGVLSRLMKSLFVKIILAFPRDSAKNPFWSISLPKQNPSMISLRNVHLLAPTKRSPFSLLHPPRYCYERLVPHSIDSLQLHDGVSSNDNLLSQVLSAVGRFGLFQHNIQKCVVSTEGSNHFAVSIERNFEFLVLSK